MMKNICDTYCPVKTGKIRNAIGPNIGDKNIIYPLNSLNKMLNIYMIKKEIKTYRGI